MPIYSRNDSLSSQESSEKKDNENLPVPVISKSIDVIVSALNDINDNLDENDVEIDSEDNFLETNLIQINSSLSLIVNRFDMFLNGLNANSTLDLSFNESLMNKLDEVLNVLSLPSSEAEQYKEHEQPKKITQDITGTKQVSSSMDSLLVDKTKKEDEEREKSGKSNEELKKLLKEGNKISEESKEIQRKSEVGKTVKLIADLVMAGTAVTAVTIPQMFLLVEEMRTTLKVKLEDLMFPVKEALSSDSPNNLATRLGDFIDVKIQSIGQSLSKSNNPILKNLGDSIFEGMGGYDSTTTSFNIEDFITDENGHFLKKGSLETDEEFNARQKRALQNNLTHEISRRGILTGGDDRKVKLNFDFLADRDLSEGLTLSDILDNADYSAYSKDKDKKKARDELEKELKEIFSSSLEVSNVTATEAKKSAHEEAVKEFKEYESFENTVNELLSGKMTVMELTKRENAHPGIIAKLVNAGFTDELMNITNSKLNKLDEAASDQTAATVKLIYDSINGVVYNVDNNDGSLAETARMLKQKGRYGAESLAFEIEKSREISISGPNKIERYESPKSVYRDDSSKEISNNIKINNVIPASAPGTKLSHGGGSW